MSLWKRIASSPEVEQHMKQYYDEKGLAEIRIYLAQWIEDRIMSERISKPTTEVYEQIAQTFYEDLQQKLITLTNVDTLKFKLTEICALITQTPALDLYSYVRNGLQKELQLLEHMPQMPYFPNGATGVVASNGFAVGNGIGLGYGGVGVASNAMDAEMTGNCRDLDTLGRKMEAIERNIQELQEKYNHIQEYFTNYSQNPSQLNITQEQLQLQLQEQCNMCLSNKLALEEELTRMATYYDTLQERGLNALKSWQRNQALAGNGAQFHDNLDDIQHCIEKLMETVCKISRSINMLTLMSMGDNTKLNELLLHVEEAKKMLVFSAFIVEKQPPQVMKTNTRFASAVRWLIGPQLGISLNNPTVDCVILSEAQAQRHSAQRTMAEVSAAPPQQSGEILNNVSTMEFHQQTRVFSASFRNMQLKKIKRAEKKGTESVMDEKFALLFYTSSIVDNCRIYVWTLSLPVVVIVHGNQEPQSWATITWDNAFSDIVREPFQVPERVSWSQLSYALNTKFTSATGRALTDENLNFLYEKLFRNDVMGGDHKDYITWAQFCKEPLPDRSFTFWDWFFAIMKLTKDHLLGPWKEGLIVGFINKRKTTDDIMQCNRVGVFLLRFSDSELGGITVAFVNENHEVMNLSPWTARDLNIRGLPDRVHDIPALIENYPTHKPKDEAFGQFYSQMHGEQTTRDGYVPNTIRAHVPAIEGAQSLVPTPQHQMQSPNHQDIHMSSDFEFDKYLGTEPMYNNVYDWE